MLSTTKTPNAVEKQQPTEQQILDFVETCYVSRLTSPGSNKVFQAISNVSNTIKQTLMYPFRTNYDKTFLDKLTKIASEKIPVEQELNTGKIYNIQTIYWENWEIENVTLFFRWEKYFYSVSFSNPKKPEIWKQVEKTIENKELPKAA